jgi:SAM-dependent methyltransferase
MSNVNNVAAQYDEIADSYAEKIANKDSKLVLKLFKKYVKPDSRVLDAGCAAGRDTNILFQNGYTVTGIDLSTKLLAIAKRNYPSLPFFKRDVRSTQFDDASFDAVWSLAVLHHLDTDDIKKTLSETKRILKPNGYVLISVKSGEGTIKTHDEHFLNQEREFHLISENKLDNLLTEAGFTKCEIINKKGRSTELTWLIGMYRK